MESQEMEGLTEEDALNYFQLLKSYFLPHNNQLFCKKCITGLLAVSCAY